MVKSKYILPFGGSDTVETAKIVNNGFIKLIHLKTPNFTNDVTTTLSIEDEEGTKIWEDSPARAKDSSFIISGLNIPSDLKYTLTATLSDEPGGSGGNVEVRLFFGTV